MIRAEQRQYLHTLYSGVGAAALNWAVIGQWLQYCALIGWSSSPAGAGVWGKLEMCGAENFSNFYQTIWASHTITDENYLIQNWPKILILLIETSMKRIGDTVPDKLMKVS